MEKVMSSSGKFSIIKDSSLVTFTSTFFKLKKRQQWATSFYSNQVPLDSSALYDSKRTHCHSIFTSLAVQLKKLNTQLRSTQRCFNEKIPFAVLFFILLLTRPFSIAVFHSNIHSSNCHKMIIYI
jgi:hypothetical protein